jgi:hypothetical protein
MVVVPLSQSTTETASSQAAAYKPLAVPHHAKHDRLNAVRVAAVGALTLSGVLLMSGRKRAGLVAAVSGTALAMLDQQESLKAWWETLPVYLDEVQLMLSRAQGAVENAAAQRDKLHKLIVG